MSYEWKACTGGCVSCCAVIGGQDKEGNALYVARGVHGPSGDITLGKLNIKTGKMTISWDGEEIEVPSYEVLTGDRRKFSWVKAQDGEVPEGAVEGGSGTAAGEVHYVGRARGEADGVEDESLGKVVKSHGCIYMPLNGKEVSAKTYKVLCYKA